jgi:hypothetical protein
VSSLPQGIDSVADLPKITEALYQRGYTRPQIEKILGGNFLRVMREVESVARAMQAERRTSTALTFEEVQLMAGNRVSANRLIDQINERGVDFQLTPELRQRLKAMFADPQAAEQVITAIEKRRK